MFKNNNILLLRYYIIKY